MAGVIKGARARGVEAEGKRNIVGHGEESGGETEAKASQWSRDLNHAPSWMDRGQEGIQAMSRSTGWPMNYAAWWGQVPWAERPS